jgi:PhnB protein
VEAIAFVEPWLSRRPGHGAIKANRKRLDNAQGQAADQSNVKPEWKDAVHARISLAGTELMAADIPNAQPMRSAYLSLSVDTDADAECIFSALSDGGEVFMPMQETFFASGFSQVRDRFGINWMILHERPMQRR